MKLLVCIALFAFVFFVSAEEELVRVARYEPVVGFTVNAERDHLSFRAYGIDWQFNIWNTDVSENSEENVYHFFGRCTSYPTQMSSFTLKEDYVTGMIIADNDTYWLEAKDPAKPLELFMHRSSDVWFHPSVAILKCSHAGKQRRYPSEASTEEERLDKRRVFRGAIYKDQYWASSKSNPSWYTDTGTTGLLNDVNAVYAAAGLSGWTWALKGTKSNSYTTNAQLNNMLNTFSAAMQTSVSPSYDTVSWLVGNNVGGLAWLSSACGAYGNYYKTAVAGLVYWSRLWTVKTIAHELGHNRGAQHDFTKQCASTQSSGCQCSVMSYCFPSSSTAGGAKNYFSSASISQIKGTCN